ncbi:MAG: GTPase HflX [Coprococcus sp.]|nr:GTPase HflX [Coprococcus sp.]
MAADKSRIYETENGTEKERIIIFAAAIDGYTKNHGDYSDKEDVDKSLDELTELLDTAGAVTVGRLVQSRDKIANDLYLGSGKVAELREMISELDATGVCCDDELSPAQLMNLQDALDIKVMDRTMVILDIFASHAGSYEGKLQVELAQLKFRATRLVGMRASLSRLGGGIGTRGPGEKKLEIDRRVIKDRISRLKSELRDVVLQREQQRKQRERSAIPVISIVGYTNAGKSTLLNKITGAGVLSEDKLFATLDPTTRSCQLPGGSKVLFTDTVGFIRKLPHHLIEAFKSTLEEAKYSDIILHVVDISDENIDRNIETVYDILRKLNVDEKSGKPVITVFNKTDCIENRDSLGDIKDLKADRTHYISAQTGEGIEALIMDIEEILRNQKSYIRHTFSYAEAGKTGIIHKYGEVLTEEYLEDGIFIEAYVPRAVLGRLGLDVSDEE